MLGLHFFKMNSEWDSEEGTKLYTWSESSQLIAIQVEGHKAGERAEGGWDGAAQLIHLQVEGPQVQERAKGGWNGAAEFISC